LRSCVLLRRRLVPDLFSVMLDHAPGHGSSYRMVPGDMTRYAADGRAFQAAFGIAHFREQDERRQNHKN
jgi:hypothetical protein